MIENNDRIKDEAIIDILLKKVEDHLYEDNNDITDKELSEKILKILEDEYDF